MPCDYPGLGLESHRTLSIGDKWQEPEREKVMLERTQLTMALAITGLLTVSLGLS